jgi:hypothetical protein
MIFFWFSFQQMLNTPKSMREDDISSMEFVNTIPSLCPNLKKVTLGHRQAERPHSLCTNDEFCDEDRTVSLSVCLSVCLSIYPSVCLSLHLSVCLSVCLSACLFVSLSLSSNFVSFVLKLKQYLYKHSFILKF